MQDLFDRPSTQDTGVRSPRDYYTTPAWMTRALLRHHPWPRGLRVLEPCCGEGAIARILRAEAGLRVITCELDPQHAATYYGDASRPAFWQQPWVPGIDTVITNPPFVHAFEILRHAWAQPQIQTVALLLRKTFLEPTRERGPWLAANPPTRLLMLPRHRFRGRSQDSVSVDWTIWDRRLHLGGAPSPAIVIDATAKTSGADAHE